MSSRPDDAPRTDGRPSRLWSAAALRGARWQAGHARGRRADRRVHRHLDGSHNLKLSLGVSLGIALAVSCSLVRVVQRSTPQFVLNALVGIGIAAVFALRSGRAEDAFLPGHHLQRRRTPSDCRGPRSCGGRWSAFMIGGVIGDLAGWHKDRRLVSAVQQADLAAGAPCILRVIVQYPSVGRHQRAGSASRRSQWAGRCRSPRWRWMAGCSAGTTARSP